MTRSILVVLLGILGGFMNERAGAGQPGGFFMDEARQPVTARLVVEHDAVQPGGGTRIGVLLTLQDGWHIYAENPGDAGMPTTITWTVSPEATVGPVHWPTPQGFIELGGIRTFGYTGKVVGSSLLQVDRGAEGSPGIELRADVRWVACQEVCVPGSNTLRTTLAVRDAPSPPSADAPIFEPDERPAPGGS